MEPRLEAGTDPERQSGSDGFVGGDSLREGNVWIPAFAGMTTFAEPHHDELSLLEACVGGTGIAHTFPISFGKRIADTGAESLRVGQYHVLPVTDGDRWEAVSLAGDDQ